MSRALQFLKDSQDPSMKAIEEWVGPGGEMGIYQSGYGYTYLFVLVDETKRIYFIHQYTECIPKQVIMKHAKAIAKFAGIVVEEDKE